MFILCDSEEGVELDFIWVAILGPSTCSFVWIIAEIIGTYYDDNLIVFIL